MKAVAAKAAAQVSLIPTIPSISGLADKTNEEIEISDKINGMLSLGPRESIW